MSRRRQPGVLLLLTGAVAAAALRHQGPPASCHVALGMEEGRIPDSAVSASSSYEPKSVGPQNARIRQEKNGGAWCPKAQISSEVQEFLEVDLGRPHLITATETQGRFGNGQGQEYAESFHLLYWRDALQRWVIYRDSTGRKLMSGNRNTYLAVRQQLELPFVASRVRFMPYSQHTRTVCMRVELYGCPWTQGIFSYVTPKGDRWSDGQQLEDLSYDGVRDGRFVAAGLGQLVDGRIAPANPEDDGAGRGLAWRPDWRWVGWHNATHQGQPVDVDLELDGPRELTAIQIHALHKPEHGIQVFCEVSVQLSLDGRHYQPALRRPTPAPAEATVNVSVPLQQRVARFVRLQLHFADAWLLVSELALDSMPVPRNVSQLYLEQMFYQQDSALEEINSLNSEIPTEKPAQKRKEIAPATNATGSQQAYVGLVAGGLASLMLLALAAAAVVVVRRGRQKVALLAGKPCGGFTAAAGAASGGGLPRAAPGGGVSMRGLQLSTPPVLARVLGVAGHARVAAAPTAPAAPRRASPAPHAAVCSLYGGRGDDSASGSGSNGDDSENSSVYHEPYKLLSAQHEYGCLLAPSKSHDFADFSIVSVSSFHDDLHFVGSISRPVTPHHHKNGAASPGKRGNYYAATDIVNVGQGDRDSFTKYAVTDFIVCDNLPHI
ncbi:epithelial discoidin domain-containing receptor 1-like [Schistocerca serialis cubense]|uniref:epithelial discoidin domain-containing receptor 1-like n=1 Tax=Schistocerca serialis cubense TaxID=2023355 RepID=UPI00214E3E80|nr:epithelial discoidin domain-containing receptor 1-like [Schistocerca serialis cubense]